MAERRRPAKRPAAKRAPATRRAKPAAKKAAKAAKKASRRPAKPARQAAPPAEAAAEAPPAPTPRAEAPLEWVPVAAEDVEESYAARPAVPRAHSSPMVHASPRFDFATGDWIPVEPPSGGPGAPGPSPAAARSADAPDAPKKSVGATVWTVVFGIDLALLALNFLAQLWVGLVLVFLPDTSAASEIRAQFEQEGSRTVLVAEQLVVFLLMGLIPFLWVLATRRVPWEGTRRYLQLHGPGKAVLQGIALAVGLLLSLVVFSSIYILLTEGPDGFDEAVAGTEDDNPAIQAILKLLTWPIALLIALTAGIGEEVLFRGVLQKRLGLWGQAILFGLSHAYGGYIPQMLVAFGIGILFGYLMKRGWSLVALMTAHFLYDFTLLASVLLGV